MIVRTSSLLTIVALACALLAASACGGAAKQGDPRYPPRAEGCDVKLFHDTPLVKTDNIGTVTARCAPDVSDADCMRQLLDETCKLGGDVVWGVDDKPSMVLGKNVFHGRAAHTKGP